MVQGKLCYKAGRAGSPDRVRGRAAKGRPVHFERNMTVAEYDGFETLDALLDGPFAICTIITDEQGRPVDYRFLRVSACFEDTTGLRNIEGRTIREIAPTVEQSWIDLCGRVALDGVPTRFTKASAVTGREYEVRAAPMNPPGRFAMVFRDLTELRSLEAEREAALIHAQHLLKELGHRVMNSFAAISAIVAMEARAAPPEGRAGLQRVQGRVQALASLYRRLDGASQMDRVEVSDYLGGIVASFRESMAAPTEVTVEADLRPMMLSIRAAVPLALVVNELLTNAVKHAFGQGRSGTVRVSLLEEDRTCRLCVADDGHGMAEVTPGTRVGRSLVAAFVDELGGELLTETGPGGTCVTVTFPA
jgi:two-component sensor histidine kinase